MIHGQRNGFGWLSYLAQRFNWTDGCIAITNAEMEEVWQAVDAGTPIKIGVRHPVLWFCHFRKLGGISVTGAMPYRFFCLVYSLRTLWINGGISPKVMLTRACIYLCLVFVLGSVLWTEFVPSRLGICFGWWLMSVASVAALDLLVQYVAIR